jgi:hypothetical protein
MSHLHMRRLFLMFAVLTVPLTAVFFLFNISTSHADLGAHIQYVNSFISTRGVAWGDVDGDGDLDLAVGNDFAPNKVYLNHNGVLQTDDDQPWTSPTLADTRKVAWADIDGDGDLDLIFGYDGAPNEIYFNEGGSLQATAGWTAAASLRTFSIGIADLNGDGWLDFIVGTASSVPIHIYYNNNGTLPTTPSYSFGTTFQRSLNFVDVNGDGTLDIVVGNGGQPNQIYLNDNGAFNTVWWTDGVGDATYDIALGDINGDGELDLVVGNWPGTDKIYFSSGGSLQTSPGWVSADSGNTSSLQLIDIDGDGDLDIVTTTSAGEPRLYRNDYGNVATTAEPLLHPTAFINNSYNHAWADMDGDGDLDVAFGTAGPYQTQIHLNESSLLQQDDDPNLWLGVNQDVTSQVLWGDIDRDGYLDLAVANWYGASVYMNLGGELETNASWVFTTTLANNNAAIALGDINNDGYLDLIAGGQWVFYNDNGQFDVGNMWTYPISGEVSSLALGDIDGDGDLDLAIGVLNDTNRIYINVDGVFSPTHPASISLEDSDMTRAVAWGDVDGDGSLDLAVANVEGPNRVYLNRNGRLSLDPALIWSSNDADNSRGLAWGDVDGDGDLDLAVANGRTPNKIYFNHNGQLQPDAEWLSGDADGSGNVAWADVDHDGDLDLAVSNFSGVTKIYLNDNGVLGTAADNPWFVSAGHEINDLAWGDVDNDGDLDLITSVYTATYNRLYLSTLYDRNPIPNQAPTAHIRTVGGNPLLANFYATPHIITDTIIPITYSLYDAESDPVGHVKVYYSTNGGGQWLPAIATTDTITTHLGTSPYPTAATSNTHTYYWDTFASGLFGLSDNVVLRLEAYSSAPAGANLPAGTFAYPASTSRPTMLRPYSAVTTFPFRVRGTQIQVFSHTVAPGNELQGAMVYQLTGNQDGQLMSDNRDVPLTTAATGFLNGRGALTLGDQLMALYPISAATTITFTDAIQPFLGSGEVTAAGIQLFTVEQPGTQQLVVADETRLLLLNLDISLEWDARPDPDYLAQLQADIRRASAILYDLTNGQMALGRITIYQAKEHWHQAHIVIYADNTHRPNADLGGIVRQPISDTLATGETIANAFLPGQIRMGATWNRYGNPGGTIGEDWPRVLAHELGHYALFLLDNYLGLDEDGLLTQIDCQGSSMTDAYRQDYSEFLERNIINGHGYSWDATCARTLAELTTGRSDWETIQALYPFLPQTNVSQSGIGPSQLPLAVTQIQFADVAAPNNALSSPFFYILDEDGNALALPRGMGKAVLIKTQATADLADDKLVSQGAPLGPLVLARGAAVGDKLCVFDNAHQQLGCQTITPNSETITLRPAPGWQPQINISPVSSTTLALTVTQPISTGTLYAQIIPSFRPTDTVTAPYAPLISIGGDVYTQSFQFPLTVFHGHVRVWVENGEGEREAISEFAFSPGWDGNSFVGWGGNSFIGWSGNSFVGWSGNSFIGWGGNSFIGWGGNSFVGWSGNSFVGWSAPVSSPDGQVIVFNRENILAGNVASTLQLLNIPPAMPSWLTPVGQVYRYQEAGLSENPESLVIQFQYLQRELPAIQETRLQLYYLPDDGQTWLPLTTALDTDRNLAAASMQGNGLYALIATIETPALRQGWNVFAYPDVDARPVDQALASISGDYTSVYGWDGSTWALYDATVPAPWTAVVNDLPALEPLTAYWVYALTDTVPYIGIGQNDALSNPLTPPATFYGELHPSAVFTPTLGAPIYARIGDTICGTGVVQEVAGALGYVVQVQANGDGACGSPGQEILFEISGESFGSAVWGNTQAHHRPLTHIPRPPTVVEWDIYLPLVTR